MSGKRQALSVTRRASGVQRRASSVERQACARATFLAAVAMVVSSAWPSAALAQAPGSPPKITAVAAAVQEVEQAERDLIRAITARDLAAYDRLVADDYVALTVEGKETTKPEVMASYKAGTRQYLDLQIHDVKVRVFGETAVLSARTTGFRLEGGRRIPNLVRYIRVYARRDGRWRAVMQMAAPIPDPAR